MRRNLRRRITDQSRYDDGVARLYRAVEMWHRIEGFNRSSISTKQVDSDSLMRACRERFLESTGCPAS